MKRTQNRKKDDCIHMATTLDLSDGSFEVTFRCKGYYSRIIHLGIIDKMKANNLLNLTRVSLKFSEYGLIDGLIKGNMKKRDFTITNLFD